MERAYAMAHPRRGERGSAVSEGGESERSTRNERHAQAFYMNEGADAL